MASLKIGYFFTILLVAATINSTWLSKKQVFAGPVVDHDFSGLKRRLLPQLNDLLTCKRSCTTSEDCNDCWVCCYCYELTNAISTLKVCTSYSRT
ncbi:hypothetical protein A4A49_42698 [Nicotiana attenuata]|uniref:Carboxypeptidase A inhibitor-like domain-containing protein n=1 Tax=Nicotiana attenuata TaxID=49451 RepID=A0A1J6JPI9_NICAT|nr:hypothetical protein A4A49_42698 [Nicotiana attenuata]